MLAELHGGQEQVGEFKNGFFPIAVGEMWFLGHKWKPSLGFCLSVGAEGTGGGVRAGCALCTSSPKLWAQLLPLLGAGTVPVPSSPWNAPTATAASPLQQQNPQSSCEREERQTQKSAPVCPQNIL